MKILILVFILILLCISILCFSKDSETFKKIPTKNLDYTASNAKPDDVFISLWNRELFGYPVPIKRNYIVDYHYITEYPNAENSFNILLDSEPADISRSNPNLLITCKKERIPNVPKVYFPYFVWAFAEKKLDPESLIRNNNLNSIISQKNKFCCFMYTNCRETMDGVRARKNFYELMQKLTNNRVDNIGRCYNDNYTFNGPWTDQIEIYKPYKFVIAFENSKLEGYITEKLAFPLVARAIPIYYGHSDANKYFNKKAYIDVNDFPDFESCINYVLKVDKDDNLYKSIINEPALIDNKVDKEVFSMYYGGMFYRELYNNIYSSLKDWIRPCKFYSNNVRMITFSDGEKFKSDRIMEQAYFSGYFKECVAYSPNDFENSFIQKHKNFIDNNKRGYGYWIWKPYFILRNLAAMKNGDYLIWLDSGSTVNIDNPKKVKEYYEKLENHDMLMFRIHHDEKTWAKMDTVLDIIDKLNKKDGVNYVFQKEPKQRTGGMIMMKKTLTTMSIIELWYNIACNYHLLDDSPSIVANDSSFKEHRHDQTILSVISKFYPSIYITDDNYSDHPLEDRYSNGVSKPFYLSRKKI